MYPTFNETTTAVSARMRSIHLEAPARCLQQAMTRAPCQLNTLQSDSCWFSVFNTSVYNRAHPQVSIVQAARGNQRRPALTNADHTQRNTGFSLFWCRMIPLYGRPRHLPVRRWFSYMEGFGVIDSLASSGMGDSSELALGGPALALALGGSS